jgi:hypothetical protein
MFHSLTMAGRSIAVELSLVSNTEVTHFGC